MTSNDKHHIFKPVSVQAMWYVSTFYLAGQSNNLILTMVHNVSEPCTWNSVQHKSGSVQNPSKLKTDMF